ncbi:MAG TPA: hypothetical protein VI138_00490 [Candidatus Dormibacteraeota bacterium]
MGTSTEQARQAVVATRGRVEARADLLEARLRSELDPRQRLRRDGAKLAVGAAAVALVGIVYVARSRRRSRVGRPAEVDWIAEMPREWRERLEELLAEAAEHGELPAAPRRGGSGRRSLAANLAIRVARMAAPVVMSAAAERIGRRQAARAPRSGAEV